MSEDLTAAKAAARIQAIARRDAIATGEREVAARALEQGRLCFEVTAGIVVSAYHPVGSELDVCPLLERLRAHGARTALPVVVAPGKQLCFRAWSPGDPLEPGVRRIPVPSSQSPEVIPAIVLIPLLAFDREGFRLGYGAGYFDRTLAFLRKCQKVQAIGIGYSSQELPVVPHELHDERLDWMMTETGAFRCRREDGQ